MGRLPASYQRRCVSVVSHVLASGRALHQGSRATVRARWSRTDRRTSLVSGLANTL